MAQSNLGKFQPGAPAQVPNPFTCGDNVSQELWRSQSADAAVDTNDSFGLLARFNSPTVANGKVFIATAGDKEPLKSYCAPNGPPAFPANFGVVVYGLK